MTIKKAATKKRPPPAKKSKLIVKRRAPAKKGVVKKRIPAIKAPPTKKKATKRVVAKKKAQIKKVVKKVEPNPIGRPLKYSTPEEMQRMINLYFLACKANRSEEPELVLMNLDDDERKAIEDIEDVVPSVSGLAYTLNLSTEALRNYQEKDEFLATVKRAKQRIEMSLEQRLAGNAVTGSIFNLKNNFGWKDKVETDITSGGKPVKNEWHLHPVSNHKAGG